MDRDPFCGRGIYDQAFLETEHFIAVYDIAPILPGHSLVIPKRHVLGITDLNAGELADLGVILKRLVPGLMEAYGTDSYNVAINAGRHAGQSVMHLHIHVVPRGRTDPFQKRGLNAMYEAMSREEGAKRGSIDGELERLRKLFGYKPGRPRR